jgi:hypothetical protein
MPRFLSALLLSTLVAPLLVAAPALAERDFPARALRGEMTALQYPYMKIGSKTLHMSAGSRIYNDKNMIVMPASVPSQKTPIMFTLDLSGDIATVWLLSAEEAKARPMPKPLPAPGGTGKPTPNPAPEGSKS